MHISSHISTDVDYVSRLDRVCVCDLARENPRGRKNPCGEGICYHVKQKEGEKRDNPRPTNRRHQGVFARARTWCSGGAGAMTGTDRTNRIVRRNPLFFFNSATFSAFASALHPRNSWIERGPTRPPLASIPNRDLEISRCAISVLLARIATPLEKSRVRCFRELSVNWFRSERGRGIKSFIGRFSPENFTRLTRLFLKRRKKTGSIYFGSLELKRTGNIFLPRFLVIGFSKRTRTR